MLHCTCRKTFSFLDAFLWFIIGPVRAVALIRAGLSVPIEINNVCNPRKLDHFMNAGRHTLDQTIDRALANAPPLLPQQIFESREIIAGEKQSSHTALQQVPHVLNGIEIWRPSRPDQGSDARLGFV